MDSQGRGFLPDAEPLPPVGPDANWGGSVFRGRYKTILVEADTYLLELLKYIRRNPLRDSLVNRLNRYAWSSHKGYLSCSLKWSWLYAEIDLFRLSDDKEKQPAVNRKFMAEAESEELTDLLSRKNLPSPRGSEGFADWVKARFRKLKGHQEVPDRRLLVYFSTC